MLATDAVCNVFNVVGHAPDGRAVEVDEWRVKDGLTISA